MWILPKQLHTSDYVPDTAALSLDSTELSEICARSLFARSKPSPARTWSQKWKRDSWTALLSGRILNPSHGEHFVTAWTSLLAVIPASLSPQPESASAQTTLATSGLSSQTEFDFFAPASASLKMSKDTSASDSEKSLESWNKLVIQRRGEYSQRLKSVRRTSASGSSSWPTISVNESKNSVGKSQEHRNSIPLGTMAAMQDAANWPTPEATSSCHGHGGTWSTTQFNLHNAAMGIGILPPQWPIRRPDNKTQTTKERMAKRAAKHGQAAPANPSTDGSRQGLWATPRSGMSAGSKDAEWEPGKKPIVNGRPITTSLTDQVRISQHWATPQAHDAQGPKTPEQIAAMRAKGHGVKNLNEMVSWATPQLQDGHNINQDSTTHKTIPAQLTKMNMAGKLNPRWVETLMGLPVGWTMPSCKSPVTIALTSCDSSATESCLPQPSELFAF
jgi:hypothetical protein